MLVARLTLLLALIGLADPTPAVGDLARSSLTDKDLVKLGTEVSSYFSALDAGDYKAQAEHLEKLNKAMVPLAKRLKLKDVSELLRYPGDWDRVFELSKVPEEERLKLKNQAGKGFFRHVFVDPLDPADKKDDIRGACLLSLPAGYGKAETDFPVLFALKPTYGLTGDELDAKTLADAKTLYEDLLPTTTILIPLGLEGGPERSLSTQELSSSWLSNDGLYLLFTVLRVLNQQVRYDRSRLFLDGWGAAGLDVQRVATGYPSWFAGMILRSAAVGADDLVYENLGGAPVLYVRGATDADVPPAADVEAAFAGKVKLQLVNDEGSALTPSAATRQATAAWMAECRRDLAPAEIRFGMGSLSFQSAGWVLADEVTLRVNVKPSDRDYPRIHARIDRAQNTIHVETVNVRALSLHLSDALLDLDKAVVVLVNGKERARELLPRSLKRLLDTRYFNSDGFGGVYPARIMISEIDPNVPPAKSP
ncbi:MAG: hypothetical protein ACT4PU_02180 [Planctomycetota bacterium]